MTSALLVKRAAGLITIQDAGRPGFMHLGIPPGGPLSPSRYRAVNAALGHSQAGQAVIEVVGVLEVVARGRHRIAIDDEGTRVLEDGEAAVVASTAAARVRYLAVLGGIDVPIVFGGRGTLLVASLGGLAGRVLRKNDVIPVGASPPALGAAASSQEKARLKADKADAQIGDPTVVRVIPGPDLDAFDDDVWAKLSARTFTVSAEADRVGTRLVDASTAPPCAVPRAGRRKSTPMVRGAIQVPLDGRLIVLGPDHPTTGGYPVVGVVMADDVERVLAAPIGAPIRFHAVEDTEAAG